MKNANLIFWVKAISLVDNFGSTRSASTSVDHKQRIKKSNFLTPRPPSHSGLNVCKTEERRLDICPHNCSVHCIMYLYFTTRFMYDTLLECPKLNYTRKTSYTLTPIQGTVYV